MSKISKEEVKRLIQDERQDTIHEILYKSIRPVWREIKGIKRHLNLTGTAGETNLERESLKFMREFFKAHPDILQVVKPEDMPTAGECTCPHIVDFGCRPIEAKPYSIIDPFCPIHGKSTWEGKARECKCNPPISGKCKCNPLLLSYDTCCPVHYIHCPIHGSHFRGEGVGESLTPDLPLNARVAKALGKKVDCNGEEFTNDPAGCSVPLDDYDTDLVAAMGALEEYCRGEYRYAEVNIFGYKMANVRINTQHKRDGIISHCSNDECESLPQAICLAIVAHSEGK